MYLILCRHDHRFSVTERHHFLDDGNIKGDSGKRQKSCRMETMKKTGVDMMKCTPSYMLSILEVQAAADVFRQLSAVILGAEPFPKVFSMPSSSTRSPRIFT